MNQYQVMRNQIENLRAEAHAIPFNIESFNHELYSLMLEISKIQSRTPDTGSFEQGLMHVSLTHQIIEELIPVVDLVWGRNKLIHADLLKYYAPLQLWRNQLHEHMQRWHEINSLVLKLLPVTWHELEQIVQMQTFTPDPKTWAIVTMD